MRASSAASASPRRFLMGPSSLLHFPSSSSIAPDAAASASLSALLPLPPLPSPYPSHVILYLQQIEHGAAAVDLVRKRPAPDLYLPPQWHATGDFSDVNAATGDFSDVMPSFPVAGPSKQRRKQRDQDLRTFVLLRCAESVNSDDLDEAPSALQEITKLATTFRTSTQRVAAYFAKAMPPRLVSSCHGICLYAPLPHASYPAASDLVNSRTAAAFEAFSVIVKLSHFKAKQPIQEAFEREGLGHILHIMIMLGLQWPGLVHILNSCSRGPPRVGLTVLGTFMEALEAAGQRPSVFADMLVLSFGFCPMAYAAGKLDLMKLGVGKRRLESVAVHWFHYSLYDVNANDSNTLCLVQRYKFTDLRESKSGMKWDLENHDGGVEEVSQKSPGLNTTPFGFVKYSNTYNPECIHETYQENTICDLDDKGEYELPKVWMGNREKHKKKEKVKAHLFTALKVTGIRNHTRYLLLIVLFCTLITTAGSSSRAERSGQGFCPKPDVIQFLLPPHEIVCPIVDISSTHWTHSKRAAPKTAQIWEGTCAIIVLIVSVVCIIGPWYSIYILQPVQGKVHKFLFFIKVEPVRMWYFTLAMSVNYYTSMIVYGIMLKSDQSCQIWAPNAIYCSIFLLLVAFLCYRERTIYQPTDFKHIFYFEKIAFVCLIVMYVFRVFTMGPTRLNFGLNILAALIPVTLLCTDVHNWYRVIVISSSVGRILECVIWAIWLMLGWNPIIVIEQDNP